MSDLDDLADGFAALGHVQRLEVLRTLVRGGESGLAFGVLQGRTGMAASTLAHHLRSLADAGLITQERQGRQTLSRPDFDRLRALSSMILEQCCADERATHTHDHEVVA